MFFHSVLYIIIFLYLKLISVIPLAQQGVFINKFLQIETYKTPLKSPLLGGKGRSPGGYFQVSLLKGITGKLIIRKYKPYFNKGV